MSKEKKLARRYEKAKYEAYLTGDTHVHVSTRNSKIGNGIYNVSLLPGCRLLRKKDGTLLSNIPGTCGGCCENCEDCCYALRYTIYHHNTCILAYQDNTLLALYDPDRYWGELQSYIDNGVVAIFRFHVAGEIPNEDYLVRLIKFSIKNPDVKFYIYTKRFAWVEKHSDEVPFNLHILVSIWHKNYDNPKGFAEFIYDDGTDPEVAALPHCPAVDKNGNETGITCARCKHCPNAKRGDRIAVYAH